MWTLCVHYRCWSPTHCLTLLVSVDNLVPFWKFFNWCYSHWEGPHQCQHSGTSVCVCSVLQHGANVCDPCVQWASPRVHWASGETPLVLPCTYRGIPYTGPLIQAPFSNFLSIAERSSTLKPMQGRSWYVQVCMIWVVVIPNTYVYIMYRAIIMINVTRSLCLYFLLSPRVLVHSRTSLWPCYNLLRFFATPKGQKRRPNCIVCAW